MLPKEGKEVMVGAANIIFIPLSFNPASSSRQVVQVPELCFILFILIIRQVVVIYVLYVPIMSPTAEEEVEEEGVNEDDEELWKNKK